MATEIPPTLKQLTEAFKKLGSVRPRAGDSTYEIFIADPLRGYYTPGQHADAEPAGITVIFTAIELAKDRDAWLEWQYTGPVRQG